MDRDRHEKGERHERYGPLSPLSRRSRFRPLREDLECYDYALELPVLVYRDIVADFDDDELEIEVEF